MGLQEVFTTVFPITDTREIFSLEFVSYSLGEPKYSVDECQERDLTFSAPLKATLRLRIREDVDGEKRDKEIIEQEVYLGRAAADHRQGDLRHQRRRAGDREPAPSLAGRVLRRQRPPQRQAALLGADHPLPRLVGRVHASTSTTSCTCTSTASASCR